MQCKFRQHCSHRNKHDKYDQLKKKTKTTLLLLNNSRGILRENESLSSVILSEHLYYAYCFDIAKHCMHYNNRLPDVFGRDDIMHLHHGGLFRFNKFLTTA